MAALNLPKPKNDHLLAERSVNPYGGNRGAEAAAAAGHSVAARKTPGAAAASATALVPMGGPAARPAGWQPPPQGHRVGRFIPRAVEDFGDGGAFPEIHVMQYPLNMGRKDKQSDGRVVPLKVDEAGKVKYDVILRQNMRSDQKVFSSFSDLVERNESAESLARPSAEDEAKVAEKTRLALGKIVGAKINAAQATHVKKEEQGAVFIRYTPSQQNESTASGAQQRIIRVQEMPVDPLEPPKFKHKKVPGGPGSPPVPVMHSPPKKASAADQAAWRVPPSVSNWKNIKGFTISLDKRLASDGRGLQEVQINDGFAKLSESLFIAERAARKEIEARSAVQKKLALKQKESKEQELRDLAARARAEVSGANRALRAAESPSRAEGSTAGRGDGEEGGGGSGSGAASPTSPAGSPKRKASANANADEAERDELDDREALRRDRVRELRRDQRMEAKKQEKGRARDERERDVSEKIALGLNVPKSREAQFDARLFNQTEGMQSGFGAEDSYDVYDKALFKGSSAASIYKPTKAAADDDAAGDQVVNAILESTSTTAKFKADREFKGTERSAGAGAHASRTKPVEFEKDESDPFNLGELLSTSAKAKGQGNALDAIGRRGYMSASGGGGGLSARADDDNVSSHHRRKGLEFEESSSASSSSGNGSGNGSGSGSARDAGGRSRDTDREGEDRGSKRRR